MPRSRILVPIIDRIPSEEEPPAAGCPEGAVEVAVGDLTQATLNSAGAGATLCLADGTHRISSTLTPQASQRIVALNSRQAVVNGSVSHTSGDFTLSGGKWFIGGQTQAGQRYVDANGSGSELGYPEQVFMDDVPLLQVASLGSLFTGQFYFDYAANQIWIADNPSGHIIEIGSNVEYPFATTNSGVMLEGLVVEKFNTYARRGAVRLGTSWTVTDCESRWNYGAGFSMLGDNGAITSSRSHDNRFAGIFANNVTDCTLTELEVDGNAWGEFNTNWESSGSKFVWTLRLDAVDCNFHDNRGAGFWLDIDNVDTTVTGGTFSGNGIISDMNGVTGYATSGFGLVAEIGYDITVTGATAEDNRGPGFISSNNTGMTVTGCTSRNNGLSIGSGPGNIYAYSQPRGNSNATTSGNPAEVVIATRYGNNPERATKNFLAHDNTIGAPQSPTTAVCGIESTGADPNAVTVFTSTGNNKWTSNTYEFAATLARYEWQDVSLTGNQWKTAGTTWLPFDTAGTWT